MQLSRGRILQAGTMQKPQVGGNVPVWLEQSEQGRRTGGI